MSWASIVTGKSECLEAVQPAVRGSLLARCRGQLLVMLGHYGWIMSSQDVDHKDSQKHGGRIYVQRMDFRAGSEPKAGDEVVFSLYADSEGLGAEDVYVVGEGVAQDRQVGGDLVEYDICDSAALDSNSSEDEYQPQSHDWTMNAHAPSFLPTRVVNYPSRYTPAAPCNKLDSFAFNMSFFDDDSDSDDDFHCCASKNSFSNASTSIGESDSDGEFPNDWFYPPPGLEAPEGLDVSRLMQPPPGLEFPVTLCVQ